MNHNHQPLFRRAILGATGLLLASPALAQREFPSRPIRLIVPWLASAAADIQLRSLAQIATRHLGQPIIIENRGGASGILGAQLLAIDQCIHRRRALHGLRPVPAIDALGGRDARIP
jgi:tripartite-type tricarboxylate transporter receptor subunit TctC